MVIGETPDDSGSDSSDGEGDDLLPLHRENALDHLDTHQREVRCPHESEREREREREKLPLHRSPLTGPISVMM